MRSVSGHHSKAKSRSVKMTPSKKYVFKEKRFFKNNDEYPGNQKPKKRNKYSKNEQKRKQRNKIHSEESDLFSSMDEEEENNQHLHNYREEQRHKSRRRHKSPSPFTKEKNFILRNKKMLESLRLKKKQALEEKKRKMNKSRNKYSHVKSKIQNYNPRSRSIVRDKSKSRRSKSINMRPSPSPQNAKEYHKPNYLDKEIRSRSANRRRPSPYGNRVDGNKPHNDRRSRSQRKFKGFNGDSHKIEDEEYEREMHKYKTKRKRDFEIEKKLRQKLKSNYADHHTQPRELQKNRKKSRRHYASPVP
jgi:hypothetical protein